MSQSESRQGINLATLPEEEMLFLRRLEDLAGISIEKGCTKFTAFLTERQQHIVMEFIRQRPVENAALFGGYDNAVRKMCGFFPIYEEPFNDGFPLEGISLTYPKDKTLTHRDFLGTLLNLGIKREAVGDILPGSGYCAVFLTGAVAPMVAGEITMVGGVGVSCGNRTDLSLLPEQEFKAVSGTVGSLRMDSLVKLLTGYAREKSAGLIRAGLVKRNDQTAASVSETFWSGDRVVVRGFGKYIVDRIGEPTRKGRLPIEARKYI